MWQNMKNGFRRFMQGRYGGDQLSRAQLIAGLVCYLLALISRVTLFSYIGLALYFWALFRMFSRNVEKRGEENRKYLALTGNAKTSFRQAKVRAQNIKQYKYFRCPKCHSYLKLPRGVGEVTVTCGKCKNQFRKKA